MQKDKTIISFLERVKEVFEHEIVDYWDADICAIGLKKNDQLAYISTYDHVELDPIKYDCDLELIDESNKNGINVVKQMRGIKEDELISEIRSFFNGS